MKASTINQNLSLNSGKFLRRVIEFFRSHWKGTILILAVTLIFFWPVVIRAGSYSPGGDSMFNAWTLARDQNCILREGCPSYINGNIFFPHKESMLYSETQLSAGLLTLPLRLVSSNPLLSNNVWTIASFFFGGWFMYLLAKFLSKGNEFYSILAGLVFEFGPDKMGATITHLQSLSIFYLPLIILLILKYFRTPKRRYLAGLLAVLILQFYASWYEMAFVLMALTVFLPMSGLLKISKWKPILIVTGVILVAGLTTFPLAREYIQFSKATSGGYPVSTQIDYSSSVADYMIPNQNTLLGDIYYKVHPHAQVNAYNPDTYSFQGFTMPAIALVLTIVAFIKRKKTKDWKYVYRFSLTFFLVTVLGFLVSLGPIFKFKATYIYSIGSLGHIPITIPLPYALVDFLVPQLNFIRAIGRANTVASFGLCCMLALVPVALVSLKIKRSVRYVVTGLIAILIFVELAPLYLNPMSSNPYYYHMTIPKVYQYIRSNKSVNNIIVLNPDVDYPGQKFLPAPFLNGVFEQVLWAGYDNKNTFNGYSGYFPTDYNSQMSEFNNFTPSDIPKMKSLGIEYILIDKLLSSSEPNLVKNVTSVEPDVVYHDSRYVLVKIQ